MTTITQKLVIPTVPNYISVESPPRTPSIDVADLPDETLRAIGEDWTAKLIEHARQRRERELRKLEPRS